MLSSAEEILSRLAWLEVQLSLEVLDYPKEPLMREETARVKVKLTDQRGKAVAAAKVKATTTFASKMLFDDATHEEGRKNDGGYANVLTVAKKMR